MRGAKDVALRGRSAAVFPRLVALVTALAVLAPSFAWAGTPYRLDWERTELSSSCEGAFLVGHNFFSVNDTPLTTYEVPGALLELPDGTQTNRAETEFDSVLLQMGANAFHFHVKNSAGDDWCTESHEVVHLVSEPLGLNKPLFNVRRSGTAFHGDTTLDLSLAEINPALARDIEILLAEIAKERAALVANARAVGLFAEKMDLLQQLDTELKDLVSRPLDEISRTDLEAILDRYKDAVAPETRAAMEQLVDDLKQSVSDLEDELARLMDEFGAQADEVADLATEDARAEGWDPDDPQAYALGESEVPWVEVPDVAEVDGAFDEGRDPYAAYADAVLAVLEADVSGRVVVFRADFVANVRAWRSNSAALEIALRDRMGVSLAETNAFLKAQNRITGFVRQFMDASDWFEDSPIPPDLRAQVDTVLKPRFDALADQMKDNLNLWTGGGLDLEQTQLYQTISAFAGAMSTVAEGFEAYAEVMQTLVHATTRIGVGFVPVVGPTLDLCEAVTGKEWCVPSGRELSDEERIFSGLGFGLGAVGHIWHGVAAAGALPPRGIRIAGEISKVDKVVVKGFEVWRLRGFKTLKGHVTEAAFNTFEKAAISHMTHEGRALLGVGDGGVRKMLDLPDESLPGMSGGKAPDFVTVSRGQKLIVSEVKGGNPVELDDVFKQLSNGMEGLRNKGVAVDVEQVELIITRGAKFKPKDTYAVKDGYLFNTKTRKKVTLKGFNHPIKVTQL
ncbi:putative secreted protein [Sorangium cellulosum So ce56]|uniref:Secreted protein n=1 Tax=Sorangium cellulosum (strain So ce56) TaxID=448385 RepID=A9G5L6_SORC5|nr:hypothetical protein [Sorangium cellulosum]CAN99046.1 putative secreted protein [Sorangium cellulosum So ce56]